MRYNNYHKHDHHGNPWTMDVIVKPEEYCKRAVELGHTTVFTTNHGVCGNVFEWIACSKQYGLKLVYGTEAYWVNNRHEKDKSNKHIIIIAKNNDGVYELNDMMTEAHSTGFYYRPRIDNELLFKLNPKNFIITTACVGGIWDELELILALQRQFGDNFYLEIQPHNIPIQAEANRTLLNLSKRTGIKLIHANDTHYIYPDDSEYRDIFLRGKGHKYQSEDGMCLDYPDSDTIFERYQKQGVLSDAVVREALMNTLVFDDCEELTIINDDIKLPSVSKTPTETLRNLINQRWIEERASIPRNRWKEYLDAIRYEMDIITKTHMENYFLIDYYVAKNAQEVYGGKLTNTGRGSAPSFYVTKLLGLTDIDRIASPITLFPTRFMSVERILGARSLPDIDLNTADRVPFIKATEDLLGKENCAWMLAWKPLQDSSAFRLFCKGIGMNISEYDEIAKNIEDYREDKKWKPIIEKSKRFVGVVESVSESPCSMLLYDKPVRRELGLVRTNSESICCLLDGYNCDKYKYLKNDYLQVIVWGIIKDVCELAKIPIPTIKDMNELLDEQTYKIYEEGLTCTINQADSEFATGLVKTYKPKSVSEMSAFVAIIRPGCASLLQDFVNRKDYTTGVEELDKILTDGNHRMIYQELIMKYLIWLGIPETGSYDIIKKIAKKKFKEPELKELKDKLLSGWISRVGTEKGFVETWTVVEQAAHYSFNASHSLSYAYDSLYGAYLKSHYPLEYYTVALNYYVDDKERTAKLTEELDYFGIKLKPIKFRYSKGVYAMSKDESSIYKGIASIKTLNQEAADALYSIRDRKFTDFIELLDTISELPVRSNQLEVLIHLDFFSEFGDPNVLLEMKHIFDAFHDTKSMKKDTIEKLRIPLSLVRKFITRETDKMVYGIDNFALMRELVTYIYVNNQSLSEKVAAQIEYLGGLDIADERYSGMAAVVDIDTKYSPKATLYSLRNGTTIICKIDKRTFNKGKLSKGNIIRIVSSTRKQKMRKTDSGFEPVPDQWEQWVTNYNIVS